MQQRKRPRQASDGHVPECGLIIHKLQPHPGHSTPSAAGLALRPEQLLSQMAMTEIKRKDEIDFFTTEFPHIRIWMSVDE